MMLKQLLSELQLIETDTVEKGGRTKLFWSEDDDDMTKKIISYNRVPLDQL